MNRESLGVEVGDGGNVNGLQWHSSKLKDLSRAASSWQGTGERPSWLSLHAEESVYLVLGPVELIELHHTESPLMGGESALEVEAARALATAGVGQQRSVWITEPVPQRELGWLAVTDHRVEFLSEDRRRVWPFAELVDLTHDRNVPETWITSKNHKRISGVRYAGPAALDVRFAIAVALAEARGQRSALVAALAASNPQASGVSRALRMAGLVYTGRPGTRVGWRVAQGVAVGTATLALLGSVLPDSSTKTDASSSSNEEVVQGFVATIEPTGDPAADAAAVKERLAREEAARVAAAEAEAATQAATEAEAARVEEARAAAARQSDEQAKANLAARRAADERARQQAAQQAAAQAKPQEPANDCTPEYPDFCIPLRFGDAYNCSDFSEKNFTALAPDPYRLDRDKDGVACES